MERSFTVKLGRETAQVWPQELCWCFSLTVMDFTVKASPIHNRLVFV